MKVGVIVNSYLPTYIAYMPKHHKTIYICSCKVDTNTIPNTTHTHTYTLILMHISHDKRKNETIFVVFGKEK